MMLLIAVKKVDVENRKAAAFENVANNGGLSQSKINQISSDGDYIKELKGLKDLLDSDIITQEEFDQKKKEL